MRTYLHLFTGLFGKVSFGYANLSWLAGALLLAGQSVMAKSFDGQTKLLKVGQNQEFQTIQSAIDASVEDYQVVIFIENGVYEERLFITRNNLALVGESAAKTVIKTSQLRATWRETSDIDWGAATVNINAANIMMVNLSIINEYGLITGNHEHQFAVRGFELSDKIITHNCNIIAGGADTLSLWNKHGRYYHSHCYFEGHTDFVCPRGTALIEHSKFFNQKQSATIWHDGELDRDHKLVVSHSEFDGIEGFWLGRHHYDAQFYLLNSTFSKNMADKPIFRKQYNNKNKERPNLYGQRHFYQGNQSANPYEWLTPNFRLSDVLNMHQPTLSDWVFNNQWQPKSELKNLSQFLKQNLTEQRFEAFNL